MKKAFLIVLLASGITPTTFAAKQWQPLRTPKAYAEMLTFTYGHMYNLSRKEQRNLNKVLIASQPTQQHNLDANAAHNALLQHLKAVISREQYEHLKQCTTVPEYTLLDEEKMKAIRATVSEQRY